VTGPTRLLAWSVLRTVDEFLRLFIAAQRHTSDPLNCFTWKKDTHDKRKWQDAPTINVEVSNTPFSLLITCDQPFFGTSLQEVRGRLSAIQSTTFEVVIVKSLQLNTCQVAIENRVTPERAITTSP
jgi:hypothetical protein